MDPPGIQPDIGAGTRCHLTRRIEFDADLGPQLLTVEVVGQLGQLSRDLGRCVIGDEGVLLIAQPFGDVDLDAECGSPGRLVGVHQGGILKAPGPDTGDQYAAVTADVLPLRPQRHRHERQFQLAVADDGGHEIHRWRADEAGDE